MEDLIVLNESLNVSELTGYRDEWQGSIISAASGIGVIVDKLNQIDAAGVQMLAALKKDVINHGKTFSIRGESDALRRQADILGLAELLTAPAGI